MKPSELTKLILAAISFLGELASVMRSNNVPLKGGVGAKVSSSKAGVREGATAWDCDRASQARLMLTHQGKTITPESVEAMERHIEIADFRAKAGYAIEKAFPGQKLDAIHKGFLALESVKVAPVKGAKVEPATAVAA